ADELRRAVKRLGVEDRVEVVQAQAEVLGRDPAWRPAAPGVVPRGFGPRAAVAEVAAGLLVVGGQLVVSEPPERNTDRWPATALGELGLEQDVLTASRYAAFTQVAPCPSR